MNTIFWYLMEVTGLPKRRKTYVYHCNYYLSAKLDLGLDKNVTNPSLDEFDKQRKNGFASEKEAFIRALIIEINRHNETASLIDLIKWSHLEKVMKRLKMLKLPVNVDFCIRHLARQRISQNDIPNFAEVNLINL